MMAKANRVGCWTLLEQRARFEDGDGRGMSSGDGGRMLSRSQLDVVCLLESQ